MIQRSSLQRIWRGLISTAGCCLVATGLLVKWDHLASSNLWSIQFIKHCFPLSVDCTTLEALPGLHQHEQLWFAFKLRLSGDPIAADKHLLSALRVGDRFAQEVQAYWAEQDGDLARAIMLWQKLSNAAALHRLARAAEESNRLADARTAYEAIWRLDSESGVLPYSEFLSEQLSDYAAVEMILRQSLSAYPGSHYRLRWQGLLAETLLRQQRWAEVIDLALSMLAESNKTADAHLYLGRAYYGRGDGLPTAAAEFQAALESDPGRADVLVELAKLYSLNADYVEADRLMEKAVQRRPDMQSWYATRALIARDAGRLEQATALYRDMIYRFPMPEFAQPAYYELAYIYLLNHQPESAVDAIEKALSLAPVSEVRYFVRAGQIYESAGLTCMARKYYENAVAVNPNNVLALAGLTRLSVK